VQFLAQFWQSRRDSIARQCRALKVKEGGRLVATARGPKSGDAYSKSRSNALMAWATIFDALRKSDRDDDRSLAPDGLESGRGSSAALSGTVQERETMSYKACLCNMLYSACIAQILYQA
jgi:hypothetical protein